MGNLAEVGIFAIQVRHDHRLQQRRDFAGDLGVLRQTIDRFAVVPVAINTNQHLGFDLTEAIKHEAATRSPSPTPAAIRNCWKRATS
jgi:hypothetical protein